LNAGFSSDIATCEHWVGEIVRLALYFDDESVKFGQFSVTDVYPFPE